MIIWITGERGAGKTSQAKKIQAAMPGAILLDGDEMRVSISTDLGFTNEDRLTNNLRIARLARVLEAQGFPIIVATICPKAIREQIFFIAKCQFIHLSEKPGG